MNIIIAGAGEVGSHLAKMLSKEANMLTIIDNDPARLNKLSEIADVITVQGQPTSIATLMQAGVENADLFIAVSPAQQQDVNILSALLAKKLGSKKVTARVNNDEYMHHVNKLMFTELGIDLLFYPEKIASYEIADLLRQTGTSEFMEFARGMLQMVVFRLDEGAPLIDKQVSDICSYEGNSQYQTVAIERNSITIIPTPSTKFVQGDIVFVICTRDGVNQAMSYSGKNDIEIKNLMIVGGGSIGEMLAKKMRPLTDNIKIIESRKERCEYLAQTLDKVLIINGDGRNSDLLLEEDVKQYDAFVAVTSSSETNILSCVAAKKMGVAKTIAEVENIEYIKLAEEMGVDAVINKKLITAGRIFRFTLSNKVRSIKCLNGSDAEILEFIVSPGSEITKGPIKDLHFPKEAIIGGIIRGTSSFMATPETNIKPYDRVVVFALPQVLAKVNKFFI
ncbi:MAG: Trk system potassium transporter TrkA [Bacteroidales bacterium]|nr:Trk system potassium transporter TrkA [Bacteroidales bacterium]MBQ1218580.1 Trk system potassium transporter TrkA [Bacteroidales bacterium]MBQ1929148.1 Trk system potassium transporter TrkA [Bacteroidales bacterium]MBQ5783555.1 Trk system potassium transporter TrkA [Bacteroidales bacterium]MBQ5863820.1 Trk system potassium transporter TrkA [Bacteroidales bacterium]